MEAGGVLLNSRSSSDKQGRRGLAGSSRAVDPRAAARTLLSAAPPRPASPNPSQQRRLPPAQQSPLLPLCAALAAHRAAVAMRAAGPAAGKAAPPAGRAWLAPLVIAVMLTALVRHGFPWEKELIYEFQRDTARLPVEEDIFEKDYQRTTVHFMSQGTRIEGWFYEPVPKPSSPPPVVILGHGLGAQKDMGLHPYAEQFAQAGMAALIFDYRGFGGSDGEVRHWVSWRRHLEDWQAALDHVHAGGLGQGRVDTSRIALWGVSYSGGHVIMTAGKEENRGKVTCIVANEPYLSGDGNIGKAVRERGVGKVARLLGAALLDKARELAGLGPVYVKLVAGFGELAILNMDPQELALSRGASGAIPRRVGGWKNVCTARMLVDNLFYKPMKHVHKVQCPTLMVAGVADKITPVENVRWAKAILGEKATLVEKPYGHLELHRKGTLPEELAPTVDFLRTQLGLKPMHVETHPHEKVPEAGAAEVL